MITKHHLKPLIALSLALGLGTADGAENLEQGEVLSKEGKVNWAQGTGEWGVAQVGQKLRVRDRLRTLELSRAMVQLAELGRVRVDELTTLEILPPRDDKSRGTIDLKTGAMYFFTRDRPREFLIQTPHALAASRGTEFLIAFNAAGGTVFTVFDGEVELSNAQGAIVLKSGEQGTADPGQPPRKTAVVQATSIMQWWIYYPGIVDLDELGLSAAEQQSLAASLAAYRQGDLLSALESYPAGRTPQSDPERAYYAAILLAAGQVSRADARLSEIRANLPAVRALREMISAVTLAQHSPEGNPETATEWLARSYTAQSKFDLPLALECAQAAVAKSPGFGFAWERVADLEFGFGRRQRTSEALDKALTLSPRNAQAWALKGFVLAADLCWRDAEQAFDQAIALDSGLGNAWLGRGLCHMRQNHVAQGRADLQTAAAMEPNRSILRSYLGKAFETDKRPELGGKEFRLAKELDAYDPTPWFYQALALKQQLRFNEAVEDLERSQELNDNRRVYRSRLLLDEDRAVRSASLATIYQDAGMTNVSVREAAKSVTADYANYSAHLFLAESFDALRDPTRFNLRYETPWFNELLLANLLSPVGGGNLSKNISQQEYSRFFQSDRLGLSSTFEGRSDGQYREWASQFGTYGSFSYALDLDYQHNDGVRINNELDRIEWYTTLKFQITPADSLLTVIKYQDYHSGDNFQYYNPNATSRDLEFFGVTNAPIIRTNFTFEQIDEPLAVLGYHHEWGPGVHTLLLGGRLAKDLRFSDTLTSQVVLDRDANGAVVAPQIIVPMDVNYHSELEIYTTELNQILQTEHHTLVLGGRYQGGDFHTTDRLTLSTVASNLVPFFNDPPGATNVEDRFQRISGYAYYTWSPVSELHLTGGVAYDRETYPSGFRAVPVSGGSVTVEKVSPKAALVWSPLPEVTVRGIYAQSLGGVDVDETYRLEPAQLAGFSQAFRSIISESVAQSVTAPTFETAGGALDLRFKTGTYVGIQGQALNSQVSRDAGVFNNNGTFPPPPPITVSSTREHLDYDEYDIGAVINQLVSKSWSVGAAYNFTRSKFHDVFPEVVAFDPSTDRRQEADLHSTTIFALFNHSSGFFARGESQWYHQSNSGYTPALAGDDFFMHNIFVGYRWKRQRGEISFGVLNLGDTDYRLNPLNPYSELPRSRVYTGTVRFNF